ncbi:40124_t:CDS:2 [Gigaspora margarita]|uniref:40124_t:CDS:1 n=1 Tax=Gigaspora margarita TaxID=4874 RepID=A0ABN7U8K6_GIGMA|nr:40124_t:CDS:2 [Gigaspora margarita]
MTSIPIINQTFITKLSDELTKDLITLLEEDDEHNVIIEAGEEPNVKKFNAHYYILRMRSPYFRQALSSRWAKQENGVYIFKKPNISPETFSIILNEVEIGNVLGAADELCLNVLVEVLQGVLMERKHLWMDKQSVLIYNAGQKYPTSAEFEKQVSIYKRLLPPELHDPDISGSSVFYTSPTYSTVASRIQSVLINPDQAARIASWIDRLDITPLENSDNKLYKSWHIPYQFKLVVRGSRDQKFLQHTLTSNQAIVIIKPSNSTEILGGYNPLSWSKKSISSNKEPQNTAPLKDSFVFSLGSDEKNDILSRVIDPKDSIYCNVYCSPVFGKGDLFPKGHFEIGQPCGCKQTSYEKPLRQSADQFIIEEFEVFQVIKKEY